MSTYEQAVNDIVKKLVTEIDRLRVALALIRDHGGSATDEGVSCNGSWCAEQARAALEQPEEKVSVRMIKIVEGADEPISSREQ